MLSPQICIIGISYSCLVDGSLPQGAVLGLIFFSIHINWLINDKGKVVFYTDDTDLLLRGDNWYLKKNKKCYVR